MGHNYVGHNYIGGVPTQLSSTVWAGIQFNPAQLNSSSAGGIAAPLNSTQPWQVRPGRADEAGDVQVVGRRDGRRLVLRRAGHNYIGHNYIGHTYIGHNSISEMVVASIFGEQVITI